jgi:hypothetical protein
VRENVMSIRRTMSLLVLVVLVVFGLLSCDLVYGIFGDPIVGTWVETAATLGGTPQTVDANNFGSWVFTKDFNMTLSGKSGGTPYSGTGTWSRDGTTYSIVTPGPTTLTGVLSDWNKTLTATGSGPGTGNMEVVVTLSKQ